MYQQKYEFDNILDVKTILGVIGTIGGAYLGAAYAGKYAINAVKQQITYSENIRIEARIKEITRFCTNIKSYLTQFDQIIEILNQDSIDQRDIAYHQEIINNARGILEELKSVNKDLVDIEIYKTFVSLEVFLDGLMSQSASLYNLETKESRLTNSEFLYRMVEMCRDLLKELNVFIEKSYAKLNK